MSVDGILIAVVIGLGLVLVALRLRKQREITRAWAAASHREIRQQAPISSDGSEPRVLQ
jgi:hypothetical protein